MKLVAKSADPRLKYKPQNIEYRMSNFEVCSDFCGSTFDIRYSLTGAKGILQ